MPIARFEMPDGRIARFEVPEGTTPEQAQSMIAEQINQQAQTTRPETPKQNAGTFGNSVYGALQGAADIGATLRAPLDMAQDWVNRLIPNPAIKNEQPTNQKRRADIAEFFQNNADPKSTAFQLSRLGTQIAGTAGVPAALAKTAAPVLGRVAPTVAPKLVTALESGGMKIGQKATTLSGKVGNAAIRTGAGATVGATQAGLVNPEDAGTGAIIGGTMPAAFKVAGEAGKLAKRGVSSATTNLIGGFSGTGSEAVSGAYQAGKKGSQAFLDNMRGKVPFDDVVDQAKAGLHNMRQKMLESYRVAKNGSAGWAADTTPLDFAPIENSFNNALAKYSFKGVMKPGVDDVATKVKTLLDTWKINAKADPAFTTAEGLDALKQQLNDIYPTDMANKAGRAFLNEVNASVKKAITDQVPQYKNAMNEYWAKSTELAEIERSLSLGDRATKDTAVRKLQSILRNNANTNYGNRIKAVQTIAQEGGEDVIPALSGQSMNSWMPRGMVGAVHKSGLPAIAAGSLNPYMLLAAPFASPRLVGEGAYLLGRATGGTANAGKAAVDSLGLLNPALLNQTYGNLTLPMMSILSAQEIQR